MLPTSFLLYHLQIRRLEQMTLPTKLPGKYKRSQIIRSLITVVSLRLITVELIIKYHKNHQKKKKIITDASALTHTDMRRRNDSTRMKRGQRGDDKLLKKWWSKWMQELARYLFIVWIQQDFVSHYCKMIDGPLQSYSRCEPAGFQRGKWCVNSINTKTHNPTLGRMAVSSRSSVW